MKKNKDKTKQIIFHTFNDVKKYYFPKLLSQNKRESDICLEDILKSEEHINELKEIVGNKMK